MVQTVYDVTSAGKAEAPAIGAPGRPWLAYAGLKTLADGTIATLNGVGIGRGDRVAMVIPNGPEMASSFVAVASGTTSAPLNPAYRAEEFEFYLDDLKPKAVIVQKGVDSPVRAVAQKLGIPLVDLVPTEGAPAGVFTLDVSALKPGKAAKPGTSVDGEIALVLHTSGTTARPKIVPLSTANLAASARHIGATLALTPADRCLNIMPLFHIHGLIAATLSSLAAGASVSCTPGFNALRFFAWLEEVKPTWYTAVPTMHQAILARLRGNVEAAKAAKLRFIRSSSSSLPPQVMSELEQAFGCPVIEAYGMTEASHQMASNALPPGKRKPGSVGLAAGPKIAVMDDAGNLLPQGKTGEVVIQGPNVTAGYDNNPDANAKAFTNGWFRTGDQGYFDEDGYLFLNGRLKEIINRGGEKISPIEIDVILMDHPSVEQCLTFAIPHPKLGEEVGAVVVLRPGCECTERELRDFVAARAADFKVPRKVLFLAEIPKGATGKLQRIGLAAKLGLGELAG
ncbi:Acyl-CoA synthetase (AMP-forming)/AMP-acid ligase II [Enhydrobacter aerosaccus]|uniref:Acyl-CoA synthetase (AMP-forming)/AMP-acid ligase II n=1 Tax=Enhydrobacter aerosaccus TaxID=225324 RepID=A0A1T4MZH2_9HYPH|nr:acyl--CoA ligase [Enhydrobacter aerosaccus]SJZ72392.1 Acyl-CoA synthetase (AMP-forming)/AMP-acid ligase II [Enhydrobacter aerosaccus]